MTYPFQFPKDCKLNSSRNPYRWIKIRLILGNASLYMRHNTSGISSYIGSYSTDAHAPTASKSVGTMFTCSPVEPLLWWVIRFPIFWGHKLEAKEQSFDEMNDILMLLKGVEFGLVKKRLVRVFFLSIFVLHHHDLTTDLLIWKTNFEWSKVSETEYEKVLCTMMRITASTGNFQTVGKRKFEHQMITLLQHPPSIPSAEYEHSKTTVPVNAMGAQIQMHCQPHSVICLTSYVMYWQ